MGLKSALPGKKKQKKWGRKNEAVFRRKERAKETRRWKR
jgi:hypothetical protein